MLPRRKPQPGGELPAAAEVARIAYSGDDGQSAECTDAADLHQAARRLALPSLLLELAIVCSNALIQSA
jgi:hypothetical protein